MKRLILSLFVFAIVYGSQAQTSAAPDLPKKLIRISTPQLSIEDDDSNVLVLKMEFNGAIPKSRLSKINPADIQSISLVYSRYRLSEMFDQLTLNAQRMDKLYASLPGLKSNSGIQWYWIEQTGCNSPDDCKDFFHGFVIKLKNESEELSSFVESSLLDYYSKVYEGIDDSKTMDSLITIGKVKLCKVCDTALIRTTNTRNRIAKVRGYQNINQRKFKRYFKEELANSINTIQFIADKRGNLNFANDSHLTKRQARQLRYINNQLRITSSRYRGRKIETRISMSFYSRDKEIAFNFTELPILPNDEEFNLDSFMFTEHVNIRCEYMDTTAGKKRLAHSFVKSYYTPDIIFKVFNRNKQWKNCLIATDVTGSMSPYLAQFRVWHKMNLNVHSSNHDFIFFNDGDNMPDRLKVRGKVGGLYYINTKEFTALDQALTIAMKSGGGGDAPENNIEAVIEGLKKNPNIKEGIMIADNWAIPRDLKLLDKVHVPIRLILCGAQNGINTAYLDMVRKNKGSIHTMENDLYNLGTLMEGKSIVLDGIEYQLKNGSFVKIVPDTLTVRR
ncbi:MAG: hypothetical protein R2852_03910 [Bacteroidia bacterium]